jgi:hypothetical protein
VLDFSAASKDFWRPEVAALMLLLVLKLMGAGTSGPRRGQGAEDWTETVRRAQASKQAAGNRMENIL